MKELLACPNCYVPFESLFDKDLSCKRCHFTLQLSEGVYQETHESHYSKSFGLQWSTFSKTQLDSANGASRSKRRFLDETGWTANMLSGKSVLDAGCGAGRFAEIALDLGGRLIAVDSSIAIHAAAQNLGSVNAVFVRSDITRLPLAENSIEFVYCIGVLQHTSNPKTIVGELVRILKKEGELVLTFYENRGLRTKLYSKYLVRPITKRIPSKILLKVIAKTSCIWYPTTKFLFSLPSPFGKFFSYIIPVANYVNFQYKSKQDAIEEAILDTFDMLSPKYDCPIKKSEIRKWVSDLNKELVEQEVSVERGTMKFKKL